MSVYEIYYKDGGAKMMRPILTREEYVKRRNSGKQQKLLTCIRRGEDSLKRELVQMNYSCLPNEDGSLKGSKRMSTTIGMDVDHIAPEEMEVVRERILSKKEELGLLMLERSARGQGYHLVFKRRPELDQVGNLKWASDLLGVEYDKGAKDITRVFFTTTDSAEDLIFLDDEIDLAGVALLGPEVEDRRLNSGVGVALQYLGDAPRLEKVSGSRSRCENLRRFPVG